MSDTAPPPATVRSWRGSLQLRLLGLTLAGLALALGLAGWALTALFRQHVERQFEAMLQLQLDQLTARLDSSEDGRPALDPGVQTDPRWSRPYSGLYWQLDTATQRGVLRSRSLWDATLPLPADTPHDGELHRHELDGPHAGDTPVRLLVLERAVQPDLPEDTPDGSPTARASTPWRLAVAADRAEVDAALQPFVSTLAASLAVLGLLLALAALGQVAIGLAPLRGLQRALAALRDGRSQRLDGHFPAEVQPLIDDFNQVLERQEQWIERARAQAGNLAHAVKTPLTVLANHAALHRDDNGAAGLLAQQVLEQVETARRQVEWHLARARRAALAGQPGLRTPVHAQLAALLRVMHKLHAERALQLDADVADDLAFLGEAQDLQELLGNLLDNACKWARTRVLVSATLQQRRLSLVIDDDGPGLDPAQCEAVLQRGVRTDEQVPGHGLGLAIVRELAQLHGGDVTLAASPTLGGLRVQLTLPGARIEP